HALRETLARRAHAVDPPGVDVQAVVAQGERRLRHRRFGAVAGTVLAVALAVAVPAVIVDLRDEPKSVEQPKPPEPPERVDEEATARPLVYAEGSILHVGSRAIDTGLTPASSGVAAGAVASPDGPEFSGRDEHIPDSRIMSALYVTDEGAVFTTLDGRVWFSDGTSLQHIGGVAGKNQDRVGAVADRCGNCLSADAVQTDDAGSRVAWLEHARGDQIDLVVYDTADRAVHTRLGLPLLRRGYGFLEDMYGDHVYWTRYTGRDEDRPQLMRTVVSASVHEPATQRMLAAERQGKARTLVVGRGAEAVIVTPQDQQGFQVTRSRLEPVQFDGDVTNANYFVPLFHPVTGERIHLRAPAGLQKTNELVLFEWLDDDRFVLSTEPRWVAIERRDIVVCRLSTERCEITVRKKPGHWLALPVVGFPG
ncbi:MAG TPA: hypothetical protein VK903_15240, partial [Propionicimonas sp.]|nr:hypothetical protein [Propionicimonas sp.]